MYEVFFAFDSAEVSAQAESTIDQAVAAFRETGAASIAVEGHTDTVGSDAYNLELSERRALAVAEELRERNVPSGVISVSGVGENDLAVPTAEGVRLRENRRVQINIGAPAPVAAPPPQPAPQQVVEQPVEEDRGFLGLGLTVAPYFGFNDTEDGDDSYLAGLNFGTSYELTRNFVASFEQAVFFEFEGEDDGIGGRTAAGIDLQLDLGGVLPYIGANIGGIYGDGSIDDDFFAGPEIGLRLGFFSAKLAYDIPFDRDIEDGIISATLGGGYRF